MEIHDRCRGPRATRGAKVGALRAKGLLSWGVGNMPVVVHGGSVRASHLEFCLALRVQHVLHPLHQIHALIVESALAGVDAVHEVLRQLNMLFRSHGLDLSDEG